MPLAKDSLSANALGGSELMKYALIDRLPKELTDEFQIFMSRVEEPLDPSKIRILWLQDLPGDPASDAIFKTGEWKKFHKIVFNTNWQMQAYCNHYQIPYSCGVVLHNAIVPIPEHEKPKDKISIGYWSTPHRGLQILVPVFEKLCEKYDNIELNVFSSFKIYGWEERDAPYQALFDRCKEHPKINYFGSIPNDELKKHTENMHIFAYPSIWTETSCICLMEAMSSGMLCVHSNLGCLYETAANWTNMYQFNEDMNQHASHFYAALDASIESFWNEGVQSKLLSQKSYANVFYNWQLRSFQWEQLLLSLVNEPREIPQAQSIYFEYKA
jgi:glycosyltransferase involved in cell wall biosynthesis